MTKSVKLPKQAILIVNAKSWQGADAFEQAREKLTAAGVELIDAKAITDPRRIASAVKKAIKAADFKSVRGAFRFDRNQFPIQDQYSRVVTKTADGKYVNKLVDKVLSDHTDAYGSACGLK